MKTHSRGELRIAMMGLIACSAWASVARAEGRAFDVERDEGIPTSLFGSFVRSHELLVYPFYEFTSNPDQEYKPSELGETLQQDFRAKRTEHEALLFVAYGFSDRLALEFESALWTKATQHTASADPSGLPATLEESGLGDTQAELRWRWAKETLRRPELYSYFEVAFPLQRTRRLIGTPSWELTPGVGAIKTSRWGTFSARTSADYSDGKSEFGESAFEYLTRPLGAWRWVAAVEGSQDEWALIGEAQVSFRPHMTLKLNNGFGLTSKAPDLAPEVGVMFSFR